jgi:pimeloyl-ACP methyl ester carboxylesterase
LTEAEALSVCTADGVRIALHRISGGRVRHEIPVLLVPGTFSTRTFWLGTRGHGFGRYLAAAGFECWIAEMRGHGGSERPRRWTMHEWIRHDAPAALEAVLEHTGAATCFWVGHSAGGVVGAGALGHRPELAARLAGMVLLGSPGPVGVRGPRRVIAHMAGTASRLLPWMRVPGEPFGLGPEWEPAPLVREWMRWNLLGIWRTPEGGDYLSRLREVQVPLLGIAGAGDRWLAPPSAVGDLLRRFGSHDRTLVLAGLRRGFERDYGHADMLVSRSASREIWPLVRDWLRARSTTGNPPLNETDHERG